MAIIITDECINCGACEPECPNTAIYEGAGRLAVSRRDFSKGRCSAPQWKGMLMPRNFKSPVSDEYYFIVP
jgi:ferredoxin